jgi:hypothetical protein
MQLENNPEADKTGRRPMGQWTAEYSGVGPCVFFAHQKEKLIVKNSKMRFFLMASWGFAMPEGPPPLSPKKKKSPDWYTI